MKKRSLLLVTIISCVFMFTLFLCIGSAAAQGTDQKKYEEYRAAIKKAYGIDIKNFKESLKGGKAAGQAITKYDLQQLLMGIKVEQEHTGNKMTALEISTDHLEEIPDYYTRLEKMEKDAEAEMEAKEKAEKLKK